MSDSLNLLLAGSFAGLAEAISVQPFDMITTRHMINNKANAGILSSLVDIYTEGGIRRFYRGMAAELIGMLPKSSGMYATYEAARNFLAEDMGYGDRSAVAAVAGFTAGVPEAMIVTPFQIVKVRLQSKEHLSKYSGVLDCMVKLYKNEGIRAFGLGLGPTIGRNCVWNCVYFGTMHWGKRQLPEVDKSNKLLGSLQTFVSGFVGAVFATCFNIPFDVVKARVQSQISPAPGELAKYRGTIQSMLLIAKEEGLFALYKGFVPKAIRMGLGGAVGMVTFEFTLSLLRSF